MMARPKIILTIVGRLGPCGCHHGHQVGDAFDFDLDRGKLCPMALHAGFPYIDILRYGGSCPCPGKGTSAFAAPMPTWPMCSAWRCLGERAVVTFAAFPHTNKPILEEGKWQCCLRNFSSC